MALADLIWVDVTWVTVALLSIAAVPWVFSLEKLPQYISSFELPGGTKVELRSASEEAKGIILEEPIETTDVDSFIEVIRQNPDLTLVGLRLEIERRLRTLFHKLELDAGRQHMSIRHLQASLKEAGMLTQQEASLLNDLWPVLNRAAHAQTIDGDSQDWAISAAKPLINNLDARIDRLVRNKGEA
ncbi:hypothetical protein [Hyphomonas sp.]|uniref:hypothetical protein n=1 Tax=Hyphomonas sp. TaxID=87 RepID=UPI0025C2D165|nr:hypothetical protein [Hyphomonas sp.]